MEKIGLDVELRVGDGSTRIVEAPQGLRSDRDRGRRSARHGRTVVHRALQSAYLADASVWVDRVATEWNHRVSSEVREVYEWVGDAAKELWGSAKDDLKSVYRDGQSVDRDGRSVYRDLESVDRNGHDVMLDGESV